MGQDELATQFMKEKIAELEEQVRYYKGISEESGRNRLREIEQLNRQITERKRAEENLKSSEKKIRSWLEYSPVCTKILDCDFHMKYMSSAGINALQIVDISKYYGKKFPFDCYPEPNRTTIIENLEKIKETGEVVTLETPVLDSEGKQLWFQSTFVPITDKDDCCEYILIVSINITDQKLSEAVQINLEKRLRQSQTIEAIGLMAGGVAHDLNNILLAIVGYPDLILMDLPKDSSLRGPILAIRESGERAASVVADLLTVARGAATTKEAHDLHTILAEFLKSPEAISLKVLYPKVTWQFRLDASQSYIYCSPVHIKKCLVNLVTNAAEAITGMGTVYITTSNQYIEKQAATDLNLKVGQYVVLKIRDTGDGISEKDIEHIYEPFYTKKVMGRSGTGLGLTVVWNTMQEHDGDITVGNTENGTCFNLYFPLTTEEIKHSRESRSTRVVAGKNEHILLVDDDHQVIDIAWQMLTMLGYSVDYVYSGEQAVEFVKKQSVDLIILDMLMPPGMNGYETYKEIVKLHPNQKAIIVSGFSESADVKATIKLGAHKYLKKPYSMDQLSCAVKEALAT